MNVTKKDIALLLERQEDTKERDMASFNAGVDILSSAVSLMCFTHPVKTRELLKDLIKELDIAEEAFANKAKRIEERAKTRLEAGLEIVAPLESV